jgi:hypothetical protein
VFELGDEHRWDAIETGAALDLDRGQNHPGIKVFTRIDHGRAMGDAGEIAEHHAETMIERHRNADPVPIGEPEGFAASLT